MIPVLTETLDCCAVCGEVADEGDLMYVETEAESEALLVPVGGMVCRDCAEALDEDVG